MYGAQLAVTEKVDEVIFGGFLRSHESEGSQREPSQGAAGARIHLKCLKGARLPSERSIPVRGEACGNLANQTLKTATDQVHISVRHPPASSPPAHTPSTALPLFPRSSSRSDSVVKDLRQLPDEELSGLLVPANLAAVSKLSRQHRMGSPVS